MRTSRALTVLTCLLLSTGCPTRRAVEPRSVPVTVVAPPPLVCQSIPGRPKAPGRLADRGRVVAPGSYRRLDAAGQPDGATFEVLPVESYLVHRTYIVEVGVYFGEVGDAWDVVEACKRALGVPAEPEPVIVTPKRSFDPPPRDECDDFGGRAGDGSCMNNQPSSALPGSSATVYAVLTWYGGWLPVMIP